MIFEIEDDSKILDSMTKVKAKERPKTLLENELDGIGSQKLYTLDDSRPKQESEVTVSDKLMGIFNDELKDDEDDLVDLDLFDSLREDLDEEELPVRKPAKKEQVEVKDDDDMFFMELGDFNLDEENEEIKEEEIEEPSEEEVKEQDVYDIVENNKKDDDFTIELSDSIKDINMGLESLLKECTEILSEEDEEEQEPETIEETIVKAFGEDENGEESLEDYIKKCQEQYEVEIAEEPTSQDEGIYELNELLVEPEVEEPTETLTYDVSDLIVEEQETYELAEETHIGESIENLLAEQPVVEEIDIVPPVNLEELNVEVVNFEERIFNINSRFNKLQTKVESNLPVFSIKKNIHKKLLNNLIQTGKYYCENTDTYPSAYIPVGVEIVNTIQNKSYYCYTQVPEKYSGYRKDFDDFLEKLESTIINYNFINDSAILSLVDENDMCLLCKYEIALIKSFLDNNKIQYNLKDTYLEIIL